MVKRCLFVTATLAALVQAQVQPKVAQRQLTDEVNVVRVAPRFATAIRMPEPVSSVVVGDPSKFLAEHSEKEPALVLVKPVVEEPTESNLLVTTTTGRHLSFLLRSDGTGAKPVDFVLAYKKSGSFLVEESGVAAHEVSATAPLTKVPTVAPIRLARREAARVERDPLDLLLERQQRAALPTLYGMRPPVPDGKGDRVKAGISEVVDQGRTVVVLFAVVNPQAHAVEVMAPQVQLAGKIRKGKLIRRSRWGSSEQLPVKDYRLSRRRLGAGERLDGVVVFDRPNFKQANEALFLQIGESGAVDRPALVPIGFGVSAHGKETQDGQ
ncbi:MAG: hypothetical protein U0Q18_37215 [Bryobacteraceae bacterium]